MKKALSVKLQTRGTTFGVCSIMNIKSGACPEDCAYCAQSRHHKTASPTYPVKSKDEIVRHAEYAHKIGARRFSLVASGRGPTPRELDFLAETISFLRSRVEMDICASLGIMEEQGLRTLKEAGLSRYHHNIETSREYFPRVCSTHTFHHRINTIKAVKSVGLQCCAGCILGLGETEADRLSMAFTLKELDVDSVPVNIFVPIEGTPLAAKGTRIRPMEIIETIAHFRLILGRPAIRLCGGREKGLMDFQAMAFLAGADAMMIGGYLTTPGRDPTLDQMLIQEIIALWKTLSNQYKEAQ